MTKLNIVTWLAALVLLVAGCATNTPPGPGGGGGGGDDDDDPVETGDFPTVGRVTGYVHTPAGIPIEGVTVDLMGVSQTTTDAAGFYVLTDVEPADMRVKFTKRGYTSNIRTVTVDGWETRTVSVKLLQADTIATLNTAAGGRIQTDEIRMDMPAGGFVDRDGNPISGDIEITVTHIDPSGDEIYAAPNDFTAITDEGGNAGLMSYAMLDVSMTTMDGEEVELADGAEAAVELLLPAELPDLQQVEPGDEIPTWHFDEDAVAWVQEGIATVIESASQPGRMAAVFEAPYFSAWNVDDCFIDPNDPVATMACINTPVTCIAGNVDDVGNNPVIGADVIAGNINLFGSVNDVTDENGDFLLWPIQVGAAVDIGISVVVGGRNYTVEDGSFVANGVQADGTDPAQCVQIPTIELPTCVVGGVVELNRHRLHVPQVDMITDDVAGRGYFFEPDGTPETCVNIDPTTLPVDSYDFLDAQDIDDGLMNFFWGQQPLDAGADLDITSETGDELNLEWEERLPGDSFYEGRADTDDVEVPFDSWVDVQANGNQGGLPPTDMPSALPLGREVELADQLIQAAFDLRKGDPMTVSTNLQDDSWGMLAIIIPEGADEALVARFNDDGALDIPAEATQQLDSGQAVMMISRVTTEMEQLPNGYWLRTMGVATTSVTGEIRN